MATHLRLASNSGESTSAGATAPINIVLAVDHAVLRRSLQALLDGEHDVAVLATPRDVETTIDCVHAHAPRVLVMDVGIAKPRAVETIRRLRAQAPETEIVVLTMEDSPLAAQRSIDAGALGFVLKDRADSELLPAIRDVVSGDEFVSSRVAAGLDALRKAVGGDGLSPRETEVVRLIALGHTSAEIAGMLHVSRRTVETQRSRIYKKLGIDTRAQLVQFALRRRLMGA